MNHLESKYKLPSRSYFSENVIPSIYKEVRGKMKLMIGEQDVIDTTADIWTSSSNMNAFLSLTAHFVDKNFKRKILVLATRHFPETHSSEDIAQAFRYILQSWGSETQQISMCITDNAANMKKSFFIRSFYCSLVDISNF